MKQPLGKEQDQPYAAVFLEQSIADELVFKGERLVIPRSLHKKVEEAAHEGHQA